MTYTVGEYVDLTFLNRKVDASASKKSVQETLYEVGTSFIFRKTKEGLQAARLITVADSITATA